MGLLDDAINQQEREESQRRKAEEASRRPGSYPPELTQVISEFLRRGLQAPDSFGTGADGSIIRAYLRMKQPGTMKGWVLFRN